MNQRIQSVILVALLAIHHITANFCPRNGLIGNDGLRITCEKEAEINIVFECKTLQTWTNLPLYNFNLSDVYLTTFENCNFPETVNLLSVTKKLGLSKINNLLFTSSKSTLSRENLKGFDVKELKIIDHKFSGLPKYLFHEINIRHLVLEEIDLKSVPEDFFKYLVNLNHLEIIKSKLEILKSNDFAKLQNLENLHLYENHIREIEYGVFDNLIKLQTLDINKNHLETLPSNLFKKLNRLTDIHLSANDFKYLPLDLFSIENSKLQNIRLGYNRGGLTSLPNKFFMNLNNLKYVLLAENNFTSIPPDVFMGAHSILRVDIRNNNLVNLPEKLFQDTHKLHELDLSQNLIETLPDEIFDNTKLDKLYLNFNKLTNLTSRVLSELASLRRLEISNNNLRHIDHDICHYLKNLHYVDLSNNELTLANPNFPIKSVLGNCREYEYLDASYNKVSQMFLDWISQSNIRNLNLEGNKFTYISAKDLHGVLNKNTTLSLCKNEITTVNFTDIEEEAENAYNSYGLHKNAKVYLEDNPFNCDCNLIKFIQYIQGNMTKNITVNMQISSENLKCASPPEFKDQLLIDVAPEKLKCLANSDVVHDACNKTCVCWNYPSKKVLSVDCSSRNLSSVPLHIENRQNYSIELDLSNNNLQMTPSLNHSYLLNVTVLNLSNNNISVVTSSVFSKALIDLKLHNNSISRLTSEITTHLTEDTVLRNLTLHQNKWICDCNTRDFLRLVQEMKLHEVMCYGTNRRISTMTANDLCKLQTLVIVSCLFFALFIMAASILVALYFKKQKKIKIWLYSKQWCLWFVTEDELDKDKKYDAFVSHSHKDEEFVDSELRAKLESGSRPFKLCLHYRDWLAGVWIPMQIARSVDESRRTIIVLSPNFLESVWGRMEFQTAHNQALNEGRARVIVILYGDIGNTDDLDPELKAYLSMNTYVKWGDPWFWDKLRYALPHRYESSKRRTRNAQIIEKHMAQLSQMNNHDDDKAEIIPLPKISSPSNDSTKLLDANVEDDRILATC